MTTAYNEKDLIKAILAKSREGYERVYQQLGGILYGIILRAVQIEQAAKELFAAVMVDIWRHIDELATSGIDLLRWIIARIVRPKIVQFQLSKEHS